MCCIPFEEHTLSKEKLWDQLGFCLQFRDGSFQMNNSLFRATPRLLLSEERVIHFSSCSLIPHENLPLFISNSLRNSIQHRQSTQLQRDVMTQDMEQSLKSHYLQPHLKLQFLFLLNKCFCKLLKLYT